MIKKFKKKPVIIEAMQLEPTVKSMMAAVDWIEAGGSTSSYHSGNVSITTLEGTMFAVPGDWIIKGVNGEFYPCKPDIFDKSYEEAND